MGDAFHQATVTGDCISVVINQIIPKTGVAHPLGERHAHSRSKAGAERAGGGFNTFSVAIFWVARRAGTHLAEVADLVHAHVVIAEQVVHGVKQHGAVTRRKHEAVAVSPIGVGRINIHEAVEQHGGNIGHAHRHAGVAGICCLNRIHAQSTDRVSHMFFHH